MAIALILAGCGDGGDGLAGNGHDAGVPDLAPGQVCTVKGCGPNFWLRSGTLALDDAQVHAASVNVCRNGECYAQSFASIQLPTQVDTGAGIEFPDSQGDMGKTPRIDATWWLEATGYLFDLMYNASTADVHDGDLYDVTITAGDGSTILEAHKTVTYHVGYPNGPECGPECRTYSDSF